MESNKKVDDDFLGEIGTLIKYLENEVPNEIMANTKARVMFDYIKRMLTLQRDSILVEFNSFDERVRRFERDCQDADYTMDVRIVTDGNVAKESMKSLNYKMLLLLRETVTIIKEVLDLWKETIIINRVDAEVENEILEANITDQEFAEEAKILLNETPTTENPFDVAMKKSPNS